MFIEFEQDGRKCLINTDLIAQVRKAKGESIEVHFAYDPWDLNIRDDGIERGANVVFFDISVDDFTRAMRSGAEFYSLTDEV